MTDSRQRFETHLEIPELMAQRDGDEYAVPFIQRYWQFWQAAEAQAVRRCAQVAGPEDSYQDEWFRAKADAVQKIKREFPEAFEQAKPTLPNSSL